MAAAPTTSHGVMMNDQTSTASNHSSPTPSKPSNDNVEIITFSGPLDKRNPLNWPETKKWLVAGMAMLGTLTMTLNGTSITIAADQISERFHVADTATFTHTYWTTTSWTLGGAVFIIVGLPLIEDIGVQVGFLTSYVLFLLFVIPQAVATNFATLVVTRFFAGGLVALCANTIASIIPDLWETDEKRSFPVSIYILSVSSHHHQHSIPCSILTFSAVSTSSAPPSAPSSSPQSCKPPTPSPGSSTRN
jgi:hypothetical protein